MDKQNSNFKDLGIINYKSAWDYQEELVKKNIDIKVHTASCCKIRIMHLPTFGDELPTINYLLFCEHPPVYTLGKSGHMENVLLKRSGNGRKGN